MTPVEADDYAVAAAAYVHVPFCSRVCPYCDFAVVADKEHLAERYVTAIIEEIQSSPRWRPLDAVYFGGGTPSHLDPGLLGSILEALTSRHGLSATAEVSLEANPEDFTPAKASALRAQGFNRVSFGAQSFDDAVLTFLGRRHGSSDIKSAVAAARFADFGAVSIDLIYGSPQESDDSWHETITRGIGLKPDHVSCYALTVEPGTALGRSVREGAMGPDPDKQADRYEVTDRLLTEFGYRRYEVSNWARPGSECKYNLIVWAQGEYLGYGNSAHGFMNGVRYRNLRRLEAYIEAIEAGTSPRAGAEGVEGWAAEIDRLFVGLRRSVGVAAGAGTTALLDSEEGRRLKDAAVLADEGDRVIVTRPLLTDMVHRLVVNLAAPRWSAQGGSRNNLSLDA